MKRWLNISGLTIGLLCCLGLTSCNTSDQPEDTSEWLRENLNSDVPVTREMIARLKIGMSWEEAEKAMLPAPAFKCSIPVLYYFHPDGSYALAFTDMINGGPTPTEGLLAVYKIEEKKSPDENGKWRYLLPEEKKGQVLEIPEGN